MSTLRVSNIEAKANVSSPTVDEKVKVTDSQGRVLLQVDGKTSGITTIGINTTGNTFTVNSNNGVTFAGIITATGGFSGNVNSTSGITTVTRFNVGTGGTVITTTAGGLVGIGTTNPQTKLHICYSNSGDGSGGAVMLDDVNRNAVIYAPGSAGGTGGTQGIYYFRRGSPSSYTDQLVIETNGNVRKPLQSFCDTGDTTSYGAAQSLVTSPGSAKGNWSSTVTNVGNNFSTSTDLYTCPHSGAYAISCTCSIDNLTPTPYRTIFVLSINGGYEEITEVFDTYENQSPCVIRYCSANDTIGLGINGTGGSSYHVRLQVYFLG